MRNSSDRVAPKHRNVIKVNAYTNNPTKKPKAKCERKARTDQDQLIEGHLSSMPATSHKANSLNVLAEFYNFIDIASRKRLPAQKR